METTPCICRRKKTHEALSCSLWVKLFKLFELHQIVGQRGDLHFHSYLTVLEKRGHLDIPTCDSPTNR